MRRKNLYSAALLLTLLVSAECIRRAFPHAKLFQTIASYTVYPILLIQRAIAQPIQHFFKQRRLDVDIQEKYIALQSSYDDLQSEYVALASAFAYYQDVKELISFKQRYMHNAGIIAHLFCKKLDDASHYALIDVGERSGIKPDMVAVYKNHIVGRVIEVYPCYSKIMLVTDKNCKIAVQCAKTKTLGIYHGSNNIQVGSLDNVSHLEKIADQDIILSSGQGHIFPQGFGVGKIVSHTSDELLHHIIIKPFVNVEYITHCMIIAHTTHLP